MISAMSKISRELRYYCLGQDLELHLRVVGKAHWEVTFEWKPEGGKEMSHEDI